MKVCTKCGVEKPRHEFNKDSSKKGGLYPSCRECYQDYYQSIRAKKLECKKKYRNENKEKISAYRVWHYRENRDLQIEQALRWAKENPLKRRASEAKRRSAKAGCEGSYTEEDVKALYSLQKGRCCACRKRMGGRYHVDHITPLAMGGGNERDNIQLLCPACNISKKAQDPVDFMQKRGYLL